MYERLLGYERDDDLSVYHPLPPAVRGAVIPPLDYRQWKAPLLVQKRQDCVQRATTSRMRARLMMMRPAAVRDQQPMAGLPSARFAYYKYLEHMDALGTDPGTQPWPFIELMNRVGWTLEEHCPYDDPDRPGGDDRPLDVDTAPSPKAHKLAFDQRNRLRAHIVDGSGGGGLRLSLMQSIASDLGVMVPIACDRRIIAAGGIPDDPDFSWDFDDSSEIVGWHMVQVEGYHPTKGLLVPNTWPNFGFDGGYFWLGWQTATSTRYAMPAIAIDALPSTTDEIQAALES